MDGQINFAGYSDRELQEALETIDGSRFPLNLTLLREEIGRRSPTAESGGAMAGAEPAVPVPPIRLVNQPMLIELVDIDALPTWEQLTIYWGFVWRSIVIGLMTFLLGVVLSFIATVFLSLYGLATGLESADMNAFGGIVAYLAMAGVGLALTWHFLRWLVQTRMGRFRLLLGREKIDAS